MKPQPVPADSLDVLCARWMEAKQLEDTQREHRVAIERKMLELVGHKEEGSETIQADHFKVTTTARLTRKVDWEMFDSLNIPTALQPIRPKRELDLTGLRWLENNEPDTYREVLKAITTKPAKTGIKVEPMEEDK